MRQIAIIELLIVVYDKHQYRHLKPLSEGITQHAHTRFQRSSYAHTPVFRKKWFVSSIYRFFVHGCQNFNWCKRITILDKNNDSLKLKDKY